ncbi:MAG: hypothetical protein HY258_05610 [Chloroflexi bacterium]|nr:hypothetical protein [Chloroflexota bacterium]
MSAWQFILIGFLLSVVGWVLPFLMVIHVIPSTFFLNFFSYTASLLGLFLGIIGASRYIQGHRKR